MFFYFKLLKIIKLKKYFVKVDKGDNTQVNNKEEELFSTTVR
jgi:hypothetical protein